MSYFYYDRKKKEIVTTHEDISGYALFKHYDYSHYWCGKELVDEYENSGVLPLEVAKYFNIKGDPIMATAKNKDLSKKHFIVRDSHHGLVGDNYTDLEDAKEAAAKQFKTKRSSTASSTLSRDIVVYQSVACIKEPVPQVDWVELA